MTCVLSLAAFNTLFLFYILSVLIVICRVCFLSWSCLFGVLYASVITLGESFLSLGQFSSKSLSMPLSLDSPPSYMPIIQRLELSWHLMLLVCFFPCVFFSTFLIPSLFGLDSLLYFEPSYFILTYSVYLSSFSLSFSYGLLRDRSLKWLYHPQL